MTGGIMQQHLDGSDEARPETDELGLHLAPWTEPSLCVSSKGFTNRAVFRIRCDFGPIFYDFFYRRRVFLPQFVLIVDLPLAVNRPF